MVRARLFFSALIVLAAWPVLALAQGPVSPLPAPVAPVISDPSNLTALYEGLVGHWFSTVSPYAYELFSALAALEFAVFGWDLWSKHSGDLRSAMLATANKVLTVGFFLALLMNGGTWMAAIINDFITIGKSASGMPGLGPSVILLQGFKIFGTLLWQATKNGFMADFPTAIALILGAFLICAAFLVISFQFIITKVQTFLAIGMGFLFLGFGGSRWTAPYVERYFAFSVASGIKLMALYLLAGAAWPLTDAWVAQANAATGSLASVEACWVIASGAVLYAGIVWFCSSIVSSMLGGSPNLSHSDFVSFISHMVSAGVSAGLIASGLVTGGTTAIAGAAVGAAGAAASAAGSLAGGGGPSGATPPQQGAGGGSSKSGASSGASQGMAAAGSLAQAGASAAGRMPHSGSSSAPPHFNGFGH